MKQHLTYVFHHLGIPTDALHAGERHSAAAGMHTSENPGRFRVQWHRFDADSPLHFLLRTSPHVAFQVEDLAAASRPDVSRIQGLLDGSINTACAFVGGTEHPIMNVKKCERRRSGRRTHVSPLKNPELPAGHTLANQTHPIVEPARLLNRARSVSYLRSLDAAFVDPMTGRVRRRASEQ